MNHGSVGTTYLNVQHRILVVSTRLWRPKPPITVHFGEYTIKSHERCTHDYSLILSMFLPTNQYHENEEVCEIRGCIVVSPWHHYGPCYR